MLYTVIKLVPPRPSPVHGLVHQCVCIYELHEQIWAGDNDTPQYIGEYHNPLLVSLLNRQDKGTTKGLEHCSHGCIWKSGIAPTWQFNWFNDHKLWDFYGFLGHPIFSQSHIVSPHALFSQLIYVYVLSSHYHTHNPPGLVPNHAQSYREMLLFHAFPKKIHEPRARVYTLFVF